MRTFRPLIQFLHACRWTDIVNLICVARNSGSCLQSSCSCQYNCHEAWTLRPQINSFPWIFGSQKMWILLFTYFIIVLSTFIMSLTLIALNGHILRLSIWFILIFSPFFCLHLFFMFWFLLLSSWVRARNEQENSVRTSQETQYVSATKPSRLTLFVVRTTRNIQIHVHCVGKMQNLSNVQAGGTHITTVL
jgi:cellulose synthase/poly-beta-1,6-N-acetylglucosamine synthase-like glycosyltransferase